MARAPRLLSRFWRGGVRGAGLVAVLVAGLPAAADTGFSARFTEPTDRYAHGVLGDAIEYGALEITVAGDSPSLRRIRLPRDRVFEDIAPRLADMDGDGTPEVIVIESQQDSGAQLAIYDATGRKIAATPHIGTRNRWLAPIGVADLDGDGFVEIAYIDRPHLAKTLRVWRYENGTLSEIATAKGLTNHKIGWDFIAGGLRDCGEGPEMVTADADWQSIMASRLTDQGITSRAIGSYTGPDSLERALTCP